MRKIRSLVCSKNFFQSARFARTSAIAHKGAGTFAKLWWQPNFSSHFYPCDAIIHKCFTRISEVAAPSVPGILRPGLRSVHTLAHWRKRTRDVGYGLHGGGGSHKPRRLDIMQNTVTQSTCREQHLQPWICESGTGT